MHRTKNSCYNNPITATGNIPIQRRISIVLSFVSILRGWFFLLWHFFDVFSAEPGGEFAGVARVFVLDDAVNRADGDPSPSGWVLRFGRLPRRARLLFDRVAVT